MNLIMPFDTETTGLPNWSLPSDADNQPHIVQLAAHLVDIDDGSKIIQTLDVIVKPNGWVIPDDESAVHGITDEYARDVGVSEKLAVEMFLDIWSNNKRIAFNTTFDNRIIRIATKRYFNDGVIDAWKDGEYECAMELARKVMGGRKPPTLAKAYKYFTGLELENAHTAIADTNACLDVYIQAKNRL